MSIMTDRDDRGLTIESRKPSLHIAIGIATSGRPEVLSDVVDLLARQSREADELIICPSGLEDVQFDRVQAYGPNLRIVEGARGSCHQRNAILAAAVNADVMVFLDDDFLPAADYVAEVERLFAGDASIVVATGEVLADGILGQGLSFAEGARIVASSEPRSNAEPTDIYNGYGCNMVVRMAPIRERAVSFDENLPLYAWQEDVDLSRQLARFGRIVKSARLRGVHLGSKRGRSPGKSLGYSQVANPVYLLRKGTLSWQHSFGQVARNFLSNGVRSLRPEPWVDRRGRLRGNLLAFKDLLAGRLSPARILEFR